MSYLNYKSWRYQTKFYLTLAIYFLVLIGSFWFIIYPKQKTDSTLRLGITLWIGYDPIFLAQHLKYYDKNIQIIELTSATQCLNAFRNNTIDIACLTLDEALLLLQHQTDIVIFLVTDISCGADVILSKPEFNSIADLKGKRIGVENTALGAYVLTRALQLAKVNLSDIKIVNLERFEHERTFQENKLDAIVTFEPTCTKLLNLGAKKLFDSKQIPNEIVDVLVVRRAFLQANKAILKKLVQGWFKTLNYSQNNLQISASYLAVRNKLTSEEYIKSLQGLTFPSIQENKTLLLNETPPLLKTAQKLADIMMEKKLLNNKINVSLLFDYKLIEDLYN